MRTTSTPFDMSSSRSLYPSLISKKDFYHKGQKTGTLQVLGAPALKTEMCTIVSSTAQWEVVLDAVFGNDQLSYSLFNRMVASKQ